MIEQPTVLAAEFPPGVDAFDFRSLIPGLDGTAWAAAFTKITLLLWIAAALVMIFFLVTYRSPKLVPTKGQWLAESVYGMVRDNIARDVIGRDGVRFAPYLTVLFCFILLNNLWGIVPFAQISPMSHIAFPMVLALVSWLLYIGHGIAKWGFVGYVKHVCWVSGAPLWVQPILVPIEFVSNLILRPVTLSVRLFANMFAGHVILKLFAGFVVSLIGTGSAVMLFGIAPFLGAIAVTALEFLVAALQAYVFAVLTCIYLSDAAHAADH